MAKIFKTQIKASFRRTQKDVLEEYKRKHPNEVVDSIQRVSVIYFVRSHKRKRKR